MFSKKFAAYYLTPLLWYGAITIGVPLVKSFFSGYHRSFLEHALSVLIVSIIITGMLFAIGVRKS